MVVKRRPHAWQGFVAVVFALPLLINTETKAETVVSGTVKRVRIEAVNSTLAEALTELTGRFGLRFRASIVLNELVTRNIVEGPLDGVVARLLERKNYFIKRNDGRVEIVVVEFRTAPTFGRNGSNYRRAGGPDVADFGTAITEIDAVD